MKGGGEGLSSVFRDVFRHSATFSVFRSALFSLFKTQKFGCISGSMPKTILTVFARFFIGAI